MRTTPGPTQRNETSRSIFGRVWWSWHGLRRRQRARRFSVYIWKARSPFLNARGWGRRRNALPVLCCCWRQAGDTCCYGGSAGTYHWKALRERRRKRAQFVPSLTSMKSTKKEQISLLEKYSQRFSQKQKQKTNLMSEDQIKLFFFLRFVSFSLLSILVQIRSPAFLLEQSLARTATVSTRRTLAPPCQRFFRMQM